MSDRPLPGDIRLCDPERDKGKHPRDITDFEIWIGDRWIHARDAEGMRLLIERCICQDQHRRGYCTEPACPHRLDAP